MNVVYKYDMLFSVVGRTPMKKTKESEIATIHKLLAELPKGNISPKRIAGKTRYYLQWSEGGIRRSRYLSAENVETVREKVGRRKALELRLKELTGTLRGKITTGDEEFETDVHAGADLKRLAKGVSGWGGRDMFPALMDYIHSAETDRLMVIYGLRRTGKTTMLRQAIGELLKTRPGRVAYIKIGPENELSQLGRDLKRLMAQGTDYVFIDEVTLMPNFIDGAAMLSDVYASMGMKIVLSGTDSLGFRLASFESLYDRAYMLHTTFIPFREHARLLKTDDIDGYIRFGGTLRKGELDFENPVYQSEEVSFRSDESTRKYIDTAIARNIQHSLANCESGSKFFALKELYDAGELTGAINRVVEDMNHHFLLEVIDEDFKSHDFGSAAQTLAHAKRPSRRSDVLTMVDKAEITKRLMKLLDIRNREDRKLGLKQEHADLIREYLKMLDLIVPCSVARIAGKTHSEEVRYLFVQPGMRYCQAQVLVKALMEDEYFAVQTPMVRKMVRDRILEDVKGRMLEDIVLLETMKSCKGRKDVHKALFISGDIDMVVCDPEAPECSVYEIKHSTERHPSQPRHILDVEKRKLLERTYGTIAAAEVLYRGETGIFSDVQYRNVNEYLKSLPM